MHNLKDIIAVDVYVCHTFGKIYLRVDYCNTNVIQTYLIWYCELKLLKYPYWLRLFEQILINMNNVLSKKINTFIHNILNLFLLRQSPFIFES